MIGEDLDILGVGNNIYHVTYSNSGPGLNSVLNKGKGIYVCDHGSGAYADVVTDVSHWRCDRPIIAITDDGSKYLLDDGHYGKISKFNSDS